MKIQFSILLIAIMFSSGIAQTIPAYEYGYDESGNRIRRELILIPDNKKIETDGVSDDSTVVYNYNVFDYEVKIYPNPTQGYLNVEIIDFPAHISAEIIVYDLQGRLIHRSISSETLTGIDFSAHPAGMYVLQLIIDNRKKEWNVLKQ